MMNRKRNSLLPLGMAALLAAFLSATPVGAAELDTPNEDVQVAPEEDAGGPKAKKKKEEKKKECEEFDLDDCRENFGASLFLGSAIDSFAARELKLYLNPDASGDTDTFERLVGGVRFGYRLWGNPKDKTRQLWVYGRTLHGVRSTDIDCKANPELFTCKKALEESSNPTEEFLFILRNASSLEGVLGLRYEFRQLQQGRDSSARLYVSGEYGFITVSGDDDDAMDMTKVGIGVVLTEGKFQGSYLELGVGESRVFEQSPTGRVKIDGLVKWDFASIANGKVSGIAQISMDSDGGPGADSIQSYFGLAYNFSGLRGKAKE